MPGNLCYLASSRFGGNFSTYLILVYTLVNKKENAYAFSFCNYCSAIIY